MVMEAMLNTIGAGTAVTPASLNVVSFDVGGAEVTCGGGQC